MRHAFVLLTLASLNACTFYGPGEWGLPAPEVDFEPLLEVAAWEFIASVARLGPRTSVRSVVVLTTNRYVAAPRDTPIRLFEAGDASRQSLEPILARNEILARFHIVGRASSWDSTANTQERLMFAALRTLELGGDGLLITRRSEIVGAIMQNARYIGPLGVEEVFYVLRRIDRSDTR